MRRELGHLISTYNLNYLAKSGSLTYTHIVPYFNTAVAVSRSESLFRFSERKIRAAFPTLVIRYHPRPGVESISCKK